MFGLNLLLTVAAVAVAAPPATADTTGPLAGGVALVDQTTGVWHLQRPGQPVDAFYYGNPGDEPFLGDWDCDGEATPGLYRRSDGYVYLRNANTAGVAHVRFYFGNPHDLPLAGDFDGDGCDTVSIYRPTEQRVYVINRLGAGDGGLGAADYSFPFGDPGDVVVAGDFDGDGVDTVAGYRPSRSLVFVSNERDGSIDATFAFGDPGDRPVAVPTLAGHDDVAVYRPAARRVIFRGGGAGIAVPWAGAHWAPAAGAVSAGATYEPPAPPASTSPTDTVVYPGESIQAAADANPPGATITIKAGVHRMQEVVPKDRQTFQGEPGAVLNGSRLLTTFSYEDGLWVAYGQTQQGQMAGRCAPFEGEYYDGCRYPENVYFDDRPLWQVTDRTQLRPGRWFFDYAGDRILLADNPFGHKVEASVSRHAFHFWKPSWAWSHPVPGDVTIRGLVIEKYANPAQRGAIQAGGFGSGIPSDGMSTRWLVEGNEIRLNHGAGVRTGEATRVIGNHIHRNGQSGVRSDSNNAVIEGNEIAYNNTLGFGVMWDAAGVKFMRTRNLVIAGNHVHHNNAPGLWADTDNVATLYENNVIEDNAGPGIFHEVSYDAVVRYNEVRRNGFATSDWLYGAGILIAHSSGVEVHSNRVEGNADGIAGIDQARGAGALGPHLLDRLWVHDNVVVLSHGWSGVDEDTGDMSVYRRDIRFERNTHHVGTRPLPFKWDDRELTPAQWLGYGHDAEGHVLP